MIPLTVDADSIMEEVERLVARRRPRRLLDAGCGRKVQIYPGPEAHITGMDVSVDELAHNDRLDEQIVGDLERDLLPAGAYDLVVCFDVLEHVDDPRRALANLARATSPGGTLILKCPNAMSFKGLFTKMTPWRLHRWAYRWLLPFVSHDPFPTTMRLMLRPAGLTSWASENGFVVERFFTWEAYVQRRLRSKLHLDGWAWKVARMILRLLTFGRVAITETELLIVLSRPAEPMR